MAKAKADKKLANSTRNKTQLTVNVFNAVTKVFPQKDGESTSALLTKYLYKKMIEDKLVEFDGMTLNFIKKA